MPAEIPTKSSTTTPAKPAEPSTERATDRAFDRFRPEMPQIPGVAGALASAPAKSNGANRRQLIQILGAAAAAVVVVVVVFLWIKRAPRKAEDPAAAESALPESAASEPQALAPAPAARGASRAAATIEELAKPWSAKHFFFAKPLTADDVEAIVIRLPGGGLWAFAVQEPYGRCQLEFVTDVAQISEKYGYRASHPMVVNPCNSTVYDPLKVGPLGNSTWARGEIVQGRGIRPPFSIDVVVTGHSIIADRME